MNVIGEAYVTIRSLGDAFTSDVEAQTAGGFKQMESDAETSGIAAGENLRGGVGGGLKDIEDDAEESGGRAGSKLSNALNDSLGSSVAGGPLSKLADMLGVSGPVALGAVAVGGALVAAGAFALKMGSDMDDATAKIAANAGISQGAATKIGDAFLSTAGKFTFSGIEMAAAYAPVAAQLGQVNGGALNAAQALGVMTAAANLAEATGSSLTSTTAILAKTLQAFQLPVKDAATVSDILYNSAKDTGQSVESMGNAMDKVRAKMGDSAPSIAQMGGLLLDLTNHGETGRASMTALSSGLNGLLDPTAKVSDAQKLLGVNLYDTAGNLLPLNQVFDILKPKLDAMPPQMAANTLAAIGFGTSAKTLASTVEAGGDALNLYSAVAAKHGAAQDAAAKATDTFAGSMDKAKAGIVDIAAKIGEKAMPMIDKLAADFAMVVTWLVAHWPEIDATISRTWDVVKPAIDGIGQTIKGTWEIVSGFIEFITDIFQGHWEAAWGAIQRIFTGVVDTIEGKVKEILGPFEILEPALAKIWSDIETKVQSVIGDVVRFFSNLPNQILTVLSNIVTTIFAPFLQAGTWVTSNVIQPIVTLFTNFPGQALAVLTNIVATVFGPLLAADLWIYNNVLVPIVTTFTSLPGNIAKGFTNVVSTIFGGLSSAASWVTSNVIDPVAQAFSALPGDIGGVIVAAFNGAVDIGSDVITWLKQGLNEAIGWYDSHRPSLFGVSLLPSIPKFADGGYVASPTIALIGEAGPEYVIPESQLRNPSGLAALPNMAGSSSGSNSGAGQIVSIVVQPGAVVITVPNGATADVAQKAVNDGFTDLSRELSASVAPIRSST